MWVYMYSYNGCTGTGVCAPAVTVEGMNSMFGV